MEIIKINLNDQDIKYKEAKEIEIIPISDIHAGDRNFNKKEFLKVINYIRDNDNVFCALTGDLINNATRNSVSDVYSEEMTPTEQITYLADLLEPIKNKILVACSGNHELRSYKESGIDIMNLVMRELGLKDRYAVDDFYLFLYFGEKEHGRKAPMVYTIYGKHGNGGAKTPGAKLNKLVEMSDSCYADIFIMSHMHEPIGTHLDIFLPDYANQTISRKKMYYLLSNSWLEFGGYGARANLRPSSMDLTCARLNGQYRKIKIEID